MNGTVSSTIVPSRLELFATSDAGTQVTAVKIKPTVIEATVPFQLPVYADDTARLAAIPTPAKGMMIFITSGTTPAATNQMQVFDGTNWVNAS